MRSVRLSVQPSILGLLRATCIQRFRHLCEKNTFNPVSTYKNTYMGTGIHSSYMHKCTNILIRSFKGRYIYEHTKRHCFEFANKEEIFAKDWQMLAAALAQRYQIEAIYFFSLVTSKPQTCSFPTKLLHKILALLAIISRAHKTGAEKMPELFLVFPLKIQTHIKFLDISSALAPCFLAFRLALADRVVKFVCQLF